MNLLSKLFRQKEKSEDGGKAMPWNLLTQTSQLAELLEESKVKTVVIFKHSTRCGISAMTLRRFEGSYDLELQNVSLYFLDLLQYRELSNQISAQFGVMHQSPQLLVLKNGQVVYHASHYDIQASSLAKYA